MKCFRLYTTEIETGKPLRKLRVPLAIIRIVAKYLPASVFKLLDSEINGEDGKELVNAVYKMIMEVSENTDNEIENGLIAEFEEYNDELKRMEHTIVYVE
jgi:hypothetical protein